MTNEQARQYLHDSVYRPIFRQKFAEYTGIDLSQNPEEENRVLALALRLKYANAVRKQQTTAQTPNIKQALYSQVDRLAGNVLQDKSVMEQRALAAAALQPGLADALSAVEL